LAPLQNPSLIAHTIAKAMCLKEEANQSITETLLNYLKNRTTLILLDNCEHLLEKCAEIVESLLCACAEIRIVATSREALRVPGESEYRVPSLSFPTAGEPIGLDEAADFDAARLFVERARVRQRDFAMTKDNYRRVLEICRRLDGIPLALELAASRVSAMTIDQIAARLDQRFQLLTQGDRTALPRARTLQACIDWSYEQLSAAQQTLLLRLSVFAGGWTLEAAEAVCAADGTEE
jgi:non-specific serine/threonine protein kinase